jgi:predicted N-acyltransferase
MRATVTEGLAGVSREQWNRVAGTAHPFLRHEFLLALERHGSVGAEYGWYPRHIVVYADDGSLLGAAPLYLKDNSYGEFVFDWSWADALHRTGKPYYPKLVSAIPYTPVTGARLLVRADADRAAVSAALLDKAFELTGESGASSLHWLFTNTQDTKCLLERGFLRRTGCHFHWHNAGYRSFDDFLSRLSSRKRKKIRRERRFVEEAGIRMEIIPGNAASEAQWQVMHRFYRSTFIRKSGIPTLSLEFFLEISRTMGEQIVLVLAYQDGRLVAGAINLRSDCGLFGRHWGCLEKFHSLHFEACYYQGIAYCIENGLALFEPGVQGEHKISRGFTPILTCSAHWIVDPPFRAAVARYLREEQRLVLDYCREMRRTVPYKDKQPHADLQTLSP